VKIAITQARREIHFEITMTDVSMHEVRNYTVTIHLIVLHTKSIIVFAVD